MEDDFDTFPMVLALDLHKTLGEIDAMPWPEYLAWQAFYAYRAATAKMQKVG